MNQVNTNHTNNVFSLCFFRHMYMHTTVVSRTISLNLLFSDNVKAYYRRAKAHVGAWNPDDAKRDFQKCLELDKSLTKSVQHDLEQLNQEIKLNDVETKLRYKNLFS